MANSPEQGEFAIFYFLQIYAFLILQSYSHLISIFHTAMM